MSIDSKEAAQIAKKHGLSLTDAAALARLAETPEEAEELAALFTGKQEERQREVSERINEQIRRRAGR